jgi:spermidine/putrescine transport system ATP-binding protein
VKPKGSLAQQTRQPGAGSIILDSLVKTYDDYTAVDDVSLEIQPGEFFSLLGSSGCGKSTTLRMIAGFVAPTSGRIVLSGSDVSNVPPERRDVNLVFQSYALFPHMTVEDNVAFGLRTLKMKRHEIDSRVQTILESVRLTQLARRKPRELSGGQRQRVALARALVRRPAALLLDEPLGALDLQLRRELQAELRSVHQQTGTTFVYVTHDQEEAMSLSDRVAVMREGRIEQVGKPRELYENPINSFVANFVGRNNVIAGTAAENGQLSVINLGSGDRIALPGGSRGDVRVAVRPEVIALAESNDAVDASSSRVRALVTSAVYTGPEVVIEVQHPTGLTLCAALGSWASHTQELRPGDEVSLIWSAVHSRVLDDDPDDA